jgi:hypothetical protein
MPSMVCCGRASRGYEFSIAFVSFFPLYSPYPERTEWKRSEVRKRQDSPVALQPCAEFVQEPVP